MLVASLFSTLHSGLMLMLVQLLLLILSSIHLLVLCKQPAELTLCIFDSACKRMSARCSNSPCTQPADFCLQSLYRRLTHLAHSIY